MAGLLFTNIPPGGRRSPPLRTRGYVIFRLVCRKSRPVSVEEEVLVYEDCSRAAYTVASRSEPSMPNTALWLLLHLDGRLERPDPTNRLVTPSPRIASKARITICVKMATVADTAGNHYSFIHYHLLLSIRYTTWRYGIMRDLYDLGIRGRLPIFVASFLSNQRFRVRIGTVLSDPHDQEFGVPQGSILSVTLFSLKINSVANSIPRGVNCSMYVDDLLVVYYSEDQQHVYER